MMLEAEGITAWIDNELLQGALGDLPLGWSTAPRVIVRQADEAAARTLLTDYSSEPRPESSTGELNCLACSAPMGHATQCPVCGWSYTMASSDNIPEPIQAVDQLEAAAATSGNVDQRKDILLEVLAVLAVGVIPNLLSVINGYHTQPSIVTFWVDALQLSVMSSCTIFVTLYLIHRSGCGWNHFGIGRPRFMDIVAGFALLIVLIFVYRLTADLPDYGRSTSSTFPTPAGKIDHLLMIVMYCLSGFSEELVCRAYLVTRLKELFRSPVEAILCSAGLFASYHIYQGLQGIVFTFIMGICFGMAFLMIRRVWPLAVGHALYNMMLTMLA